MHRAVRHLGGLGPTDRREAQVVAKIPGDKESMEVVPVGRSVRGLYGG